MEREKLEWKRVLWKRQPFPDNYVGESFLRVSKKCKKLSLTEALYGATAVTHEICSCLGLVVVFFGMSEGNMDSSLVLSLTAILGVIGYVITRKQLFIAVKDDAKVACFYVVLIGCVSPVIKSLTGSVATDSINACTTLLLLLRLILHDYGTVVAIVNSTVSHNVGLFASVCLASRLEKDLDVFTLITVAVALFALLPTFRRHCRSGLGRVGNVLMTCLVVLVTGFGVCLYAAHLLPLMALALVFCNCIIPALYISCQSHKQNIYGPWDEAQIEER